MLALSYFMKQESTYMDIIAVPLFQAPISVSKNTKHYLFLKCTYSLETQLLRVKERALLSTGSPGRAAQTKAGPR